MAYTCFSPLPPLFGTKVGHSFASRQFQSQPNPSKPILKMSRATAHKQKYASHLRMLKYLVKLYNEHQSDQNTIPNPLIQLIHERLEHIVPPSIYRNTTDYKTASNELLDLEIIANDLRCNHKNKAEEDTCQFVLLHDCIEHRLEDMKRLDAHVGMSGEHVEQKWKRYCGKRWRYNAWK